MVVMRSACSRETRCSGPMTRPDSVRRVTATYIARNEWNGLTTSGNFVVHSVEKSNIFQNSSTKGLDKVGDEDARTAKMRTAARAPQGGAHEYFRARPAPAPHQVGSTRFLCRDRPQ